MIGQDGVSEYEYISHPWNSMHHHNSPTGDWRLGSMFTLVTRNGHASLQLMHAGVMKGLVLIMCLLVPE